MQGCGWDKVEESSEGFLSGAISGWRTLESDGNSDVGVGKLMIGSWEIIGQFIGSSEIGAETREEVLLDRQMEEASQSLLYVSGRE